MKQTHTLITLIIAVVLSVLFAIGYGIMVSPNEKQAKKYDEERAASFQKIETAMGSYKAKNKSLPKTLQVLVDEKLTSGTDSTGNGLLDSFLSAFASLSIRDPQTNKPYEYKFGDAKSDDFELCANFAYANEPVDKEITTTKAADGIANIYYQPAKPKVVTHGKGEQCVKFSLPKIPTEPEAISKQPPKTTFDAPATSAIARDSQRKTHLRDIRNGLEQYYNDYSAYPKTLAVLTTDSIPYLKIIPKDPSTGGDYTYSPSPTGGPTYSSYTLRAKLENTNDKDIKTGSGNVYEIINAQ